MNTDKELTPEEQLLNSLRMIAFQLLTGVITFDKYLNKSTSEINDYGRQQYEKGRQESIPYTLEDIEKMAHDKAVSVEGSYDYSAFVDGARWLFHELFKQESKWI